jgi:hypothetical protein
MHPGTDLATAAEHLYKAHSESTDPDAKATDIAYCGICFWFAVLAFFRLGAKTNIGSCKSGAPEELFLTMTLKPAEYPGGVIGDHLRSAVSPSSMRQIKRCLDAAQFCFQRATELGKPGLGILWQVALYRGTGRFPECAAAATAARSHVSDSDRKDIDSYARTYAGYDSDFSWLANAPCKSIIVPEKWVQSEILECMNRPCELIESDVTYRSTESANKVNVSTTTTPPGDVNQQRPPKKEAPPKGNAAMQISEEAANKIKAEYTKLMEPENMTRDARGMVSSGGDVAFQIARAYRRLQERYRTEMCKKYSITPETLDSIIKGTFTPSPSANSTTTPHAPDSDVEPGKSAELDSGTTAATTASSASAKKGANNTSQKKGCFIATACYGSTETPEVLMLRRFRDESLLTSVIGQRLVLVYYKVSPPIARQLVAHPKTAKVIRTWLLDPMTRLIGKHGPNKEEIVGAREHINWSGHK